VCYCLGNHLEEIGTRFEQIRRGMKFLRNRKQKDFAIATFQVWRREINHLQYQVKISNFATRRVYLGDARFEIRVLIFGFLGLATRNPEFGDAKSNQTGFKPLFSTFSKHQTLTSLSV